MSGVSIEDKKTWLKQGLEIEAELTALKATRQRVYDDATSITGKLSAIPKGGKRNLHMFDALMEIDDFIKEKEKDLICRREKLIKSIYTLPEGAPRRILVYKYIHGMKMEAIADELGYCERNVHKLHTTALKQIQVTPQMLQMLQRTIK